MDQSADSRRRLPIFRRLTAAATVDRLPSSVLSLQSSEPDAPCSMLDALCSMLLTAGWTRLALKSKVESRNEESCPWNAELWA